MLKRGCVFAILFIAATGKAQAQVGATKVEFFAEGGVSFLNTSAVIPPSHLSPVSSSGNVSKSARVFTGFRYQFTKKNALEGSYSYSYNVASALVHPNVRGFASFEAFTGSVNYVRYFPAAGRFRPFATAGLGLVSYISPFLGFGQHAFAPNVGLGTDIALSRRLALRVEARDFITRLPRPLSRTNHNLVPSAGVALALHAPPAAREGLPRLEFHLEGGGSFLTNGSSAAGPPVILSVDPTGQAQQGVFLNTSSFSKTGRILAGFRARATRLNGLDVSWSHAPVRYIFQELSRPPVIVFGPQTKTQYLEVISSDYVRYVAGEGRFQPFVLAGIGFARYSAATIFKDIDKVSANFGAGVDARVNKVFAFRFEFRDFIVAQPDPVRGVTHSLAPMAGIVLSFQ